MDLTDVRPTLMYLTGLKDDYEHDGRVVTQLLARPNQALAAPGVSALGACYKQLNSSVGEFGTATLQASTDAVESTSAGDATYIHTNQALTALEQGQGRAGGQDQGRTGGRGVQQHPGPGAVRARPSPARPSSRPRSTWRPPADLDANDRRVPRPWPDRPGRGTRAHPAGPPRRLSRP